MLQPRLQGMALLQRVLSWSQKGSPASRGLAVQGAGIQDSHTLFAQLQHQRWTS